MPIGDYANPPRRKPRKPGKPGRRQQPGLLAFAAAYGLAWAVSIAVKALAFGGWIHPLWLVAAHLACGYGLNRYVLNRLEWNPNFTTLATAAKAKLLALVGWPVAYAVLLAQLWVVRYL